MPKVTKEQLQKQNTILEEKLTRMVDEDRRLREVFSDLLDSSEFVQEYGFSHSKERKVVVRSWEGIAFMIGELKSDADYSALIEKLENLKKENLSMAAHIHQLENPRDKRCEE